MKIRLVMKGQRQLEALKVNTSLTEINLSRNKIGFRGKAIGEALKVNTSCRCYYSKTH